MHTITLLRESEPLLQRGAAGPSETGPSERERDGGASRKKSIRPHDFGNGLNTSLDSRTAFILSLVDPLLRLDGTGVLSSSSSSSSSSEPTLYTDPISSSQLSLGNAACTCEEGPEPDPDPAAGVATTVSSSSGSSLRLCRGCSELLGWPCGCGFVGAVVACDAELWLGGGFAAALDIAAGWTWPRTKEQKKKAFGKAAADRGDISRASAQNSAPDSADGGVGRTS